MPLRIAAHFLPTRKVTAATGGAALAGAIVAAIGGIMPMDEGTAAVLTLLVDMAIGAGLTGLATFVAGYMIRERSR